MIRANALKSMRDNKRKESTDVGGAYDHIQNTKTMMSGDPLDRWSLYSDFGWDNNSRLYGDNNHADKWMAEKMGSYKRHNLNMIPFEKTPSEERRESIFDQFINRRNLLGSKKTPNWRSKSKREPIAIRPSDPGSPLGATSPPQGPIIDYDQGTEEPGETIISPPPPPPPPSALPVKGRRHLGSQMAPRSNKSQIDYIIDMLLRLS